MEEELDKSYAKLESYSFGIFVRELSFSVQYFLESPVRYILNSKKLKEKKLSYSSSTKLSDLRETANYLRCDDGEILAKALQNLIFSWSTAKTILDSYGVESFFILQPTASYKTDSYLLDRLVDSDKQAIVNEAASYEAFYSVLKNKLGESYELMELCQVIFDFSEILFDLDQVVFIDTCHLGPAGDLIVAKEMAEKILTFKN